MDERKRRIDELEKNKRGNRFSLDTLLENFGERLYSRIEDIPAEYEDVIQFRKLQADISSANASISAVEKQDRRYRELEDTIEIREQEEKERSRQMSGLFGKLGMSLLADSEYNDYTSSWRENADALSAKVESLSSRISELENKEGGNVFSWIGKSAQGLVLRSFLTKAQENQEQLYKTIGERYSNREYNSSSSIITTLSEEIAGLRSLSRTALNEIGVLKDEKRAISAAFGLDGSPQKQIQNIRNQILKIKEELRFLYMNFGAQAAGIMDAQISPERKYFIDNFVSAEDSETIGRAVRLNQAILDDETAIAKLKAAIAIDEEKSKIEKFKRSINEKRDRIAELERAIIDIEDNIRNSESEIRELENQL
jgi:chromosome segregation ATPase